jgi:hypothetical protein
MIIFDSKEMGNDYFNQNLINYNSSQRIRNRYNNESINDYKDSGFKNFLSSSLFLQEHSSIENYSNQTDSENKYNLEFNNDDSKSDFLCRKKK